jgi:hypothetical protein
LEAVTLAPAPDGMGVADDEVWLAVTIPRGLTGAANVLPQWQARMVAASLDLAARAAGVVGVSGLIETGSGAARLSFDQAPRWPDPPILESTIRTTMPRLGQTVDSVSFFCLPQGSLPVVYAHTDDEARADKTTAQEIFGTDDLPGYFIHRSDPLGAATSVIGNAAIAFGGVGWSRKRYPRPPIHKRRAEPPDSPL